MCDSEFIAFTSIPFSGETSANADDIIQGQLDTALNDCGREQARRLGEHLPLSAFTHVFSSDLKRAFDTATLAFRSASGGDCERGRVIVRDRRLREISFGSLQGRPRKDLNEAAQGRRNYVAPGGESHDQMKRRVIDFFTDLCRQLVKETVAGAHDATMRRRHVSCPTKVAKGGKPTPVGATHLTVCPEEKEPPARSRSAHRELAKSPSVDSGIPTSLPSDTSGGLCMRPSHAHRFALDQ